LAGASGGGSGTAAAPFAGINAALAAARPGDVIQVAAGAYPENVAIGRSANALVETNLTLLGGFSPDFATRDASKFRSVIDGGGIDLSTRSNDVADNVVRGNEIGVTVMYGYGGGILIAAAPATLRGNVITGNYAPTNGSGVFWDEGATGTMTGDLLFANGCPS